MDNLARNLRAESVRLVYGVVQSCVESRGDAVYKIAGDDGALVCERADGCLLKPEKGDLVLAVSEADGRGYVLSVIKRAARGQTPAKIEVPGDLNIAAAGDLTFAADNDVSLAAGDQITLVGATIAGAAEDVHLQASKISVAARLLSGGFKAVTLAAGAVEHVFDRLTQKLRNSVRLVEEHDEVAAGSARMVVAEDYAVQSRNEAHLAEEVVKIDAEEVHLG
ncbi:MAG: hypothetical protein PWQ57_356 [Desulfovibrionales bacterium]|nr:hypothetical protein [Desulfovibrionales bacterium]